MITDIRVRVYADAECTQLVTTVTSPSVDLVQDFALIGLAPDTTYWAVGVAQDEFHIESESEPWEFTTLAYTIDITGSITYGSWWDRLNWDMEAEAPQGITITGMGVELSLNEDFSTIDATAAYNEGAQTQTVSPVLEHTLYYVRYYVTTNNSIQHWQDPQNPTILTRWAPPVINVTADHITTNSMVVTVSYTGGYPIDHNSLYCTFTPTGGTSTNVNLERLEAGQPELFTISGLSPNTDVYVEVDMDYYEDDVIGSGTFTTAQAQSNYIFTGTVSNYETATNIYPTQMISSCTVTLDDETQRATWLRCGIEYCADDDFTTHVLSLERSNTNTWSNVRTTNFNEHKLYYYRFYAESEEYGLQYSSVGTIWSRWNKPSLRITVDSTTETTVTVTYLYDGKMPIEGQANRSENPLRIDVEDDNGDIVKTVGIAGQTIAGEERTVTIDGLEEATHYTFYLRTGYYWMTLQASDDAETVWGVTISNFSYGWSGKGELSTMADYSSSVDPVSVEIVCEAGPSTAWTAAVNTSMHTLSSVPSVHDRMFHHDGSYTVKYRLTSPNGTVYTSEAFSLEIPDNTGVRITDTILDYDGALNATVDFSIEVPSIVVCGAYSAGVCRYDGESVDYTEEMEGTGDWATGKDFSNRYEIGGTGLYNRPQGSPSYVVGGLRYACGYMEDCFFKRFEGTHYPFVISYVHCYANTCGSANISAFNFKYEEEYPEAYIQIDTDYNFPNPTSVRWSWDGRNVDMGVANFNNLTPSGRYYYRLWNDGEVIPRVFCYPRQVTLLSGGLTMDSADLQADGLTKLFGSCWYALDQCSVRKEMVKIHLTGTDGTDVWIPSNEISVTEGRGGEISFSHDIQLVMGETYRADYIIGTVSCFAQVEIGVIHTTFTNGEYAFSNISPEARISWEFTSTDPLLVEDLTIEYTDDNGTHQVPDNDIIINSQDGGYSGTVSFSESGSWTGGQTYTATVSADGVTAGATGQCPSNTITVGVDEPIRPVNIITVSVATPTKINP